LPTIRGAGPKNFFRSPYVTCSKDGREHLQFTEFYEAILEAKGVHLPGRRSGLLARRNAQGRQLSFNTHVHFNGNLMVGRAYLAKLHLQPGDRLRIQFDGAGIRLTPLVDALS
jgi:hypothetical protein